MSKIFLFLVTLVFFTISSVEIQAKEINHTNNTASYINKVALSIAKQLKQNGSFLHIKEKTIIITSAIDINDFKSSSLVTKRVDENLIYTMSKMGFKIVDTTSLKMLGARELVSDCILTSSFTKYKYEMVINSRIVDRKSGLVISVSQVKIPKKIIKDVNRLYKKSSWFSK